MRSEAYGGRVPDARILVLLRQNQRPVPIFMGLLRAEGLQRPSDSNNLQGRSLLHMGREYLRGHANLSGVPERLRVACRPTTARHAFDAVLACTWLYSELDQKK